MQRRQFLKLGGGAVALLAGNGLVSWSPRAHAQTVQRTLYITDGTLTQPDGTGVYFRGFSSGSGQLDVPAIALVVQEGDAVEVTLVNTLSTTHRFKIEGVIDSGPIAGGSSMTVNFSAASPGSYLFYDAENAPYNRLLGLHGGLAVMPQGSGDELYPGSPTFAQQLFWVFNDIDPVWHAKLQNGQTPDTGFEPRYFTINGLSSRPPGHPDYNDPDVNAFYSPDTALHGAVGERTLIRLLNAGLCQHSVHWHANHVEWLTENGAVRPQIWKKDVLRLPNQMGRIDCIFPFEPPPDAYPAVTTGMYPMHLHDEMTQTAGGGLYQFGASTHIEFVEGGH